jgi:hypothetical protein
MRARLGVTLALVLGGAAVLSATAPAFATRENLTAVALGMSLDAIVAVGMTVLFVSGGFDLSVGAVMGLAGTIAALVATQGGDSAAAARPAWRWEPHPSRPKQEITLVKAIGEGSLWEELTVPIHGCVVRERDERQPDGYQYWVFGTTNLALTASGIIRSYEARSECEEDHRQIKGPQWELDEFTSTKQVEILFHVLMVLLAYNLCQVYGQTQAGQRFAGKTKRARQRELRREGTRRLVVIAGPYYAVLEELDVAEVLLEVEGEPKERLRGVVRRLKDARKAGKRPAVEGVTAGQAAYQESIETSQSND